MACYGRADCVSDVTEEHDLCAAELEACVQAGIPRSRGHQRRGPGRRTWFQYTIRNGQRNSTAVGYLHPVMGRKNLTVETEAHTTRILFEGKKAVGVEFLQKGQKHIAKCQGEVILAAGAVASPQILECSGVGQAAVLKAAGLPVVHELKGVGENMQDHYMLGCQYRLSPNTPRSTSCPAARGWSAKC